MKTTLDWHRGVTSVQAAMGAAARVALVAVAMLACDGATDDDGGSTGPIGTIALAVTPATLSVPQGSSAVVTLTLTRGGGFAGAVTLAAEGVPAGMTASVSPATLTGATTSATVTVTVAPSVATGSYPITVRATAPGVGDATAPFGVTVTTPPGVSLSLAPAALTILQGASATTAVTITRTNFTGAVALSLEGAPPGVTGAFTPASTTTDNASLTLSVAITVPPGNYPITVKATAAGIADRTATLALTVTAAPVIAISIAPTTVAVMQGGSGEVTITIVRTNLTAPVQLSVTGAPTGLAFTFEQNPTSSGQVRLSFVAAGTTTVATYTITITAQAPGAQTVTATFTVQVQAAAGNQVEFQFCSASENPLFFAARDGAGAWQVVTGTLASSVYRYRFTVTQAVGAVFYVQQSGSALAAPNASGVLATLATPGRLSTRLFPDALARLVPDAPTQSAATTYESTAYFATATELATIGTDNCAATQSTKSVWLQVTGVGNGQEAVLSLGGVTEFFDGTFGLSPVEFTGVRSGLVDFFGVRASSLTGVPTRILDVRNLNPADGSTLPFTADFNSVNAYDPAAAVLTIGNALGDELLNFTAFSTANGDGGTLAGAFAPSAAVTRTWYGIPTAKLQAGDVHANVIFASPAVSTTNEQRYHFQFTTTVQNLSPALGARLPTHTVSVATSSGYRRIRVQGALPSEYEDLVTVQYEPSAGGNEVWLIATRGYLAAMGGTTSYDLTTPDVGALPGFPLASAPEAGEWEVLVNANGWSGLGITAPAPVNGATFVGAAKQVKITLP